jgi:hypothetical protein
MLLLMFDCHERRKSPASNGGPATRYAFHRPRFNLRSGFCSVRVTKKHIYAHTNDISTRTQVQTCPDWHFIHGRWLAGAATARQGSHGHAAQHDAWDFICGGHRGARVTIHGGRDLRSSGMVEKQEGAKGFEKRIGMVATSNMIRALKDICAANFLLAALLYGIYVVYCLSNGIDMDEASGLVPHGRGGPAWVIVAVMEIQLLVVFGMGWFADEPQRLRLRLGYDLWGVMILVFLCGYFDHNGIILVRYAACSDIAYGCLGSNDT